MRLEAEKVKEQACLLEGMQNVTYLTDSPYR